MTSVQELMTWLAAQISQDAATAPYQEVELKALLLALAVAVFEPVPTPVGYPPAARRLKVEVEAAEEKLATMMLQILAKVYADRPGYRPEWRLE